MQTTSAEVVRGRKTSSGHGCLPPVGSCRRGARCRAWLCDQVSEASGHGHGSQGAARSHPPAPHSAEWAPLLLP